MATHDPWFTDLRRRVKHNLKFLSKTSYKYYSITIIYITVKSLLKITLLCSLHHRFFSAMQATCYANTTQCYDERFKFSLPHKDFVFTF